MTFQALLSPRARLCSYYTSLQAHLPTVLTHSLSVLTGAPGLASVTALHHAGFISNSFRSSIITATKNGSFFHIVQRQITRTVVLLTNAMAEHGFQCHTPQFHGDPGHRSSALLLQTHRSITLACTHRDDGMSTFANLVPWPPPSGSCTRNSCLSGPSDHWHELAQVE